MTQWYKEDLAYIHDVGHSDYALKSAPAILNILVQKLMQPKQQNLQFLNYLGRQTQQLQF